MTGKARRGRTTPRQDGMVSLMVAAGRLQQALEDVCGRRGLTHDQYNVLRILRGAHPVGHPRYAIAERLISRAPDVTRLLNRLESQGLVERYRSEEDHRLSMSRVTDKGLGLLGALDPEVTDVHERASSALTLAQVGTLASLCVQVSVPENP